MAGCLLSPNRNDNASYEGSDAVAGICGILWVMANTIGMETYVLFRIHRRRQYRQRAIHCRRKDAVKKAQVGSI